MGLFPQQFCGLRKEALTGVRMCLWCWGSRWAGAEPVPVNHSLPPFLPPVAQPPARGQRSQRQTGVCFLRVQPWPHFGAPYKHSAVIYWGHAKPLAFGDELKSLWNIIEKRSISISFFIIHISIIYFNFL